MPGKGKGVLSARPFRRSEFVCEYHGELLTKAAALQREQAYLAVRLHHLPGVIA